MTKKRAAVYLVAGPDFGRREQAIAAIREVVAAHAGGEDALEVSVHYADDLAVNELVKRLYNMPLFHAHVLVVYRNAELARDKDDVKDLRAYIAAPSEYASLVLVSEETAPKAGWAKAIPKAQTTVCWQPFKNETHATIRRFFSERGQDIASDLVEYIVEICGGDSRLVEQLCQQIVYFFRSEREITDELLYAFLEQQHASSIFKITDALFARHAQEAVAIVDRLHLEHTSSNSIAGFVNAQMQKLWRIACHVANGVSDGEAMKKVGVVRKRQMDIFQHGLRAFPLPELSRLIVKSKKVERDIRALPEEYGYLLLTQLILQVCAGLPSPVVPASSPPLVW